MKDNTSSKNRSQEMNKDLLRQNLDKLVKGIRWLATHPIACLAILVVPVSLYLCVLSAAQVANRANVRTIATLQAATAAAMQTPIAPTALPTLTTPLP